MTRMSINEGLDFILGHFLNDNALWPKLISYGKNWNIRADNRREAIHDFAWARLINCRICPFPDFVEDYRKPDAREAMSVGGIGIVPNFLFLDIDRGRFSKTLESFASDKALNFALYKTLDNINERFHGNFKPTIIWTGNGFHIYLPVQLSGPSWCLGHTDVFMNLSKTPDRDFLRWAEYYLTDGLADPAHYTTTSFNNMWCRIPGSFNKKDDITKPVTVLQKWDGQRPYINWILRDFHRYLVDKNLKPAKESLEQTEFSSKWN